MWSLLFMALLSSASLGFSTPDAYQAKGDAYI